MFCVLYFLFLCVWPGMVLNQGQLSIVVSDWEPYLGALFSPPVFVGGCLCLEHFAFELTVCLCSVNVLFGVILIKIKKMYAHHSAPWSSPLNSRDNIGLSIQLATHSEFLLLLAAHCLL